MAFTIFPTDFPDEILINILKYLSTFELIQFCRAFNSYDYFLKEKYVNRFVNWSKMFEAHTLDVCKIITTKMDCHYIKILNISYAYWVPNKNLKNLIRRLENLKCLYAIDTKLTIKEEDISEYIKLEKLALSVEDNRFGYSTIVGGKNLVNMQSLCLKVTLKMEDHTGASGFVLFLNNLKSLKELWIFDEDCSHNRINYERIVLSLKNLNKFVLKSRTVLPMYDFSYIGLHKVFECKRTGSQVENIFEKLTKPEGCEFSIFEPKETELEKAWDTFVNLHKDLPCGPKEGKLIFMKEDIKNIYFEDLNFCHSIILCNSMYINAALQILSSKNATRLKRLSTRSCLFRTSDNEQKTDTKQAYDFNTKRQRVGIQYDPDHPFKKIAQNIQGLIELEVYTCSGCHTGIYSAYFAISTFENLQKLTLEVPVIIDGKFLKEVFINCKKLYSVNFINRGSNETFSMNLCNSLKYATALRDFRLEQTVIPAQKLLKGFNDIETKKLLRIVIKCEYFKDSSLLTTFSEFMENNPQLVFFFMVISKNTIRSNSSIHETLNSFKKGNPAKMFYVKKEINSFSGVFPIPTAHHDLIFNRTNVSVINIDDF